MNVAGIRRLVDELFESLALGKRTDLLFAFEHLQAMGRDEDPGAEARQHLDHFAVNCLATFGCVNAGEELAKIDAMTDDDVGGLCEYIATHPLFEFLNTGERPDKRDMMLAFALQTGGAFVGADGPVASTEVALVHGATSPEELRERGLFAGNIATQKFVAALSAAPVLFPTILAPADKAALVEMVLGEARSRGRLGASEVAGIRKELSQVGLSRHEIRRLVSEGPPRGGEGDGAASSGEIRRVEVSTGGKAVLVLLDLEGAIAQWGGAAWTMIEDHLVRVLLSTMTPTSKMIIRAALDTEYRKLSLSFQYHSIRGDFAHALFGVFDEFRVGPICVGAVVVAPGLPGLFAAFDGRPIVLVREVDGGIAVRQVLLDKDRIAWAYAVMPDEFSAGRPIPFTLQRATALADGEVVVQAEDRAMLEPAILVER